MRGFRTILSSLRIAGSVCFLLESCCLVVSEDGGLTVSGEAEHPLDVILEDPDAIGQHLGHLYQQVSV